ncbi:uncharacterized protein B0J16DRAFT_386560 [Fusarium flagelliforme]|uniref:Altered inheritance of mitochondria protein 9, mitochondrial n=1 Tax=Fusarium flagelliforme TaxID=2675880 RepID=A0A395MBP3_9HYPO|nr:uncharacterized protein B0J16DRAFT_386560 [Fusarium flagelliforme]KAH7183492.1 hypothetical protein B0J16DRAFT_386560 [Fusarium flagelliforme]RFN45337.1 altered inheritance of mitochondria protein 9, mitochondrial [Fusarium flagelliforme]
MLAGDNNTLSGIIDWEFVSTLPLWAITKPPKFLDGYVRNEAPDPETYGSDDGQDNEGKSRLYWSDLEEYENTLLQDVYNDRMSQLNPDWERLKREGRLCNDMREAIDSMSIGFYGRCVKTWLDKIEDGDWHEKLASDDFPRFELPY